MKDRKKLRAMIEEGIDALYILANNLNVSEDYMIDQYLTVKEWIKQEPSPLRQQYYAFRLNRTYKPKGGEYIE